MTPMKNICSFFCAFLLFMWNEGMIYALMIGIVGMLAVLALTGCAAPDTPFRGTH